MKSLKKGFTLIELLIVITIIGILAVAFLPQLLGAPSKARDTQRKAALQGIAGVLTQSTINGDLPDSGCIAADNNGTALGGKIKKEDFGGTLPLDPQIENIIVQAVSGLAVDCAGSYAYAKDPTGDGTYSFGVYALMENVENANAQCSAAFDGEITLVDSAPNGDGPEEWCYAILVQ